MAPDEYIQNVETFRCGPINGGNAFRMAPQDRS